MGGWAWGGVFGIGTRCSAYAVNINKQLQPLPVDDPEAPFGIALCWDFIACICFTLTWRLRHWHTWTHAHIRQFTWTKMPTFTLHTTKPPPVHTPMRTVLLAGLVPLVRMELGFFCLSTFWTFALASLLQQLQLLAFVGPSSHFVDSRIFKTRWWERVV